MSRHLFETYRLILLLLSLGSTLQIVSQPQVNYDESKVRPYTLEDPLCFVNGKKVHTVTDWEKRRQEILGIFQREMYGQIPPASPIWLDTQEEGITLGGFAWRKQVRMFFRADRTGPYIDWLILIPCHIQEPAPVIMTLNYYGNHTILADKEIIITKNWMDNDATFKIVNNHATEEGRGVYLNPNMRSTFPVSMILARGYAFVTACYADISPDPERRKDNPDIQEKLAYTGVFSLWGERDSERTDNTTALGAWGWALMRGMDMIECDSMLNEKKVVVTGSSRLGKAALIAGAFDTRFPVVVLNQTGGGGAPLAKRNFGENVATEISMFTHWYCKAYSKYAGHEENMPFDQHLLLSCIAPRALLVEGFDEKWFDTKGEFLALQAASPVWEKLGKKGLPCVDWPNDYDTSAIGVNLGYVRRNLRHGLAVIDWEWMLSFADQHINKK